MPPYSAVIQDHFHNPRQAFRMADPSRVGRAGTPGRGPYLVLYLKLGAHAPEIEAASFQTYGCPPAIAAGSLLCERLPGLSLEEAQAWTRFSVLEAALGGVPRHKRHTVELACSALSQALKTER